MLLSFDTLPLREVCENEDAAIKEYGSNAARLLRTRLADLRAYETVGDIMVGHPREINCGENSYAVNLGENYQLVFCANHINVPMVDGKVDWSKVTRIKILKIRNSHD